MDAHVPLLKNGAAVIAQWPPWKTFEKYSDMINTLAVPASAGDIDLLSLSMGDEGSLDIECFYECLPGGEID